MNTKKIKITAYILACFALLFFVSCERNDLYNNTKHSILSIINMAGTPYIALFHGALKLSSGSTANIGEAAIAGPGNSTVFTVQNTGDVNLVLTGVPVLVSITGVGAGDYTIIQPATNVIAPGGTVTFSVTFTPSAAGARDAALTIQNNDPNGNPFIINLTGTGLVPTLVIHGNISSTTSLYNQALNTFTPGPPLPSNVNDGGLSFQIIGGINNGRMMMIYGGITSTTLYDPATGTVLGSPLTITNPTGSGAHSVPVIAGTMNGQVIIVCGNNGSAINVYDPVTNSFPATALTLAAAARWGSHSIPMPSGDWIVVHGNNTATTSTFSSAVPGFIAGPAIPGISTVYFGGHSFLAYNGFIITVLGNGGNKTTLFNPAGPSFSDPATRPTLSNPAGSGANTFMITSGINIWQSLIIHGNGTSTTSLYDPFADSFSPGPNLPGNASNGSHNFQINGGPYAGMTMVILGGGTNATALYDPASNLFFGFPTSPNLTGNAGFGSHSFPAR
jgi:hypothetical protein